MQENSGEKEINSAWNKPASKSLLCPGADKTSVRGVREIHGGFLVREKKPKRKKNVSEGTTLLLTKKAGNNY